MNERVILAALKEIEIHSLRFRMIDLTRRLHISKTSLYKIVESKDQLIYEIINYLMNNFNQKEKSIRSADLPVKQKIIAFVCLYTEAFKRFDKSIYTDLRTDYSSEWHRWSIFREKKINVLMDILEEGIQKHEFRKVNLDVMHQCLLVTSEALSEYNFLKKSNLTYSEALKNLGDIIFFGLENK
ncbi:TetR/AcrR family transcriptional regulator [Pectinatus frisingensis]|jgi:AcrR family transcriptional regulator|uniref:TetR/AcrR family transcriptional regulator n=1 Tax=Pectinatus frisingensis TaxID=865 RepID=UPI0018C75B7F|nr:TetR/AcrR family transcriptional regulator [Pectinatus frisingensis]